VLDIARIPRCEEHPICTAAVPEAVVTRLVPAGENKLVVELAALATRTLFVHLSFMRAGERFHLLDLRSVVTECIHDPEGQGHEREP
jgi:hypothetical protein